MKYVLAPFVLPIGLAIVVISLVVIGSLFAVQAVFGHKEPVLDD